MNLRRSDRICLGRDPVSNDLNKTKKKSKCPIIPKTRYTTRIFKIHIIALKTNFQIYICVLVLLHDFMYLMTEQYCVIS